MKCLLCGRDSPKPVCKICARELVMDTPFLLKRGFAVGDFVSEEPTTTPVLFPADFERLNALARRAIAGEDVELLTLARVALRLHEEHGEYLELFELERTYYLRLAEEFASRIDTDEGKYLLAQVYDAQDNIDAAQAVAEEIWRKDDEYALYYGKLLVRAGKWGRAIEIYDEILKNRPEDARVWELLADALYSAEQYDEAERAYLRVLQLDKDNPRVWFKRGKCLRAMGKWGGALQSFQTAVRRDPKFRDAYEGILEILLERNMYSRARETLKRMKDEGFDVDERIQEVEGLMGL